MGALPLIARMLRQPQVYQHRPAKIDLIQTQMSFVFLTGDYVYKVKKSVDLGYLDYTTLDKRRFFCHQELELNRRLCPEAYLAVVPIVADNGGVAVEGEGEAIEYAVKMRQLPLDRMMDVLLPRGQVTQQMIADVAGKLVRFHREARSDSEISSFGRLDTIERNTAENFSQTEKYRGLTVSAGAYDAIRDYTQDFLRSNGKLFEKRVSEGRIRDCHGDLHAAHICFTDSLCIYDCIEFNDRFRYSDVASEIAFLAMDLDRYGRADLSQHMVGTYIELSQDADMLKLLNFYKCYRAYVRGKVGSFKLDDPYVPEREKSETLEVARRYFELAESYVRGTA